MIKIPGVGTKGQIDAKVFGKTFSQSEFHHGVTSNNLVPEIQLKYSTTHLARNKNQLKVIFQKVKVRKLQ